MKYAVLCAALLFGTSFAAAAQESSSTPTDESIRRTKESERDGSDQSRLSVARTNMRGVGVKRNLKEAVAGLQKLADSGNADATFLLVSIALLFQFDASSEFKTTETRASDNDTLQTISVSSLSFINPSNWRVTKTIGNGVRCSDGSFSVWCFPIPRRAMTDDARIGVEGGLDDLKDLGVTHQRLDPSGIRIINGQAFLSDRLLLTRGRQIGLELSVFPDKLGSTLMVYAADLGKTSKQEFRKQRDSVLRTVKIDEGVEGAEIQAARKMVANWYDKNKEVFDLAFYETIRNQKDFDRIGPFFKELKGLDRYLEKLPSGTDIRYLPLCTTYFAQRALFSKTFPLKGLPDTF